MQCQQFYSVTWFDTEALLLSLKYNTNPSRLVAPPTMLPPISPRPASDGPFSFLLNA
jgi:hypothetical protein